MESQDFINVELKVNEYNGIQNKVTSRVGILSDKVGSGKTFTMLALMAEKEHIIRKKSIPYISSRLVSISTLHNESNNAHQPKTNLIIIPHSLVKQWKDSTIRAFKNTDITYKFMTTKKECNDNTKEIFDYDVVIVTIRQLESLGNPGYLHFCRIVIDEPHDLSIPTNFIKYVKFEHMWFVCATPRSLIQNNRNWIKSIDIHKEVRFVFNQEDYIPISDIIAIRNRPEVINASLNLPEYTETWIECLEPSWLPVLRDIPSNALERLHANDIRGALEVLQCPCKEGEDILTALTREYAKNVEIAEIEVKKYTEMPPHLIPEQTRKNKIEQYQKKVIEFKEKIQHIKTRIDQHSDCPICLYDISDPRAITPCCQNSFCLECILESTRNGPRCPLCKNNINIKDIIIDHNNAPANPTNPTESKKKSKIDTLMNILKNRTPDQKFIVVSKYASVFHDIKRRLKVDNQCDISILSGTGPTINRSIENFKNGIKPIILINTQYFGSGLNLEMATDVIVYHRLSDVDLKQAIGRAQRIGRTSPLCVTYLTHESEY